MSIVRVTYTGVIPPGVPIVNLPPSKSILAREMMLAAHFGQAIPMPEKGSCEDILNLYNALNSIHSERVDIGESGTACRFLLSLLANRSGTHRLTGSPRLLQRPIRPLADALISLGAEINVSPEEIIINGGRLQGETVRIDASESSQYVSSLMLLGARLPHGLQIEIEGEERSTPYILMTAEILRRAGIRVDMDRREIKVHPTADITIPTNTERDWSAASYFYEIMALTGQCVAMPGLGGTLQGDRRAARLFAEIRHEVDMSDVPDLVPAYAATMCGLGKPFHISGIRHLRYKESDRLWSVSGELRRLGFAVEADSDGLHWDGLKTVANNLVDSHNDHRIVMALAPLSVVTGAITIDGAEAVCKSFPAYFEELTKIGYKIDYIPSRLRY